MKILKADLNCLSPSDGQKAFPQHLYNEDLAAPVNAKFFTMLALMLISAVFSCSDSETSSALKNPGKNLRLVIKWPGDDLATKNDLETLNKIGHLIAERQIGKILRSGTGMGWMEIVVEVHDMDSARIKIEEIVKEVSPDSKFAVQGE